MSVSNPAFIPPWLATHIDNPPSAPNVMDDEFDASATASKWSTLFSLPGTWTFGNSNGYSTVSAWLSQTKPATPCEFLLCGHLQLPFSANSNGIGIGFCDSASGKIATLTFRTDGTSNITICVFNWTSGTFTGSAISTTSVTSTILAGGAYPVKIRIYLKVKDDGTNFIYKYSFDGVNFNTILSHSRTTFVPTGGNLIVIKTENFGAIDYFRRTL